MKNLYRYTFILFGVLLVPLAMASAPIESLIGEGTPPTQQYTDANHNGSANIQAAQSGQITLLNQVNELQNEVRALRGALEMQQHNMKLLQQQQLMLYQDLNQRLGKLDGKSSQSHTAIAISPTGDAQKQTPVAGSQLSVGTDIAVKPAATGSPAVNHAPKAVSQTLDIKEEQAYQSSYQYILDRQYSKAIQSMQQFLKDYPNTRYQPNAHYWLGQLYLIQDNLDLAYTQFNQVVSGYPNNPKASDALYKIGYIAIMNKDYAKAQSIFQQVKQHYPNSNAAKQANARLEALGKAGYI